MKNIVTSPRSVNSNGDTVSRLHLVSKKLTMIGLPLLLMLLLSLGMKKFDTLSFELTRRAMCIFFALIFFSVLVDTDNRDGFYKKAFAMSVLFQTIFISQRFAPFVIESLYTMWLLSQSESSKPFLMLINFVISFILMATVLPIDKTFFDSALLEKIIIYLALLRCIYVNYQYTNRADSEELFLFEDVIFSTLFLFMVSQGSMSTSLIALFLIIPALAFALIVNGEQYKFASMLVWQYFILATTGVIQAVALSLYLISLRALPWRESKKISPSISCMMLYVVVLMLFIMKNTIQGTFSMGLVSILALHWIFFDSFFIRLADRNYLKLTLLIFVVYLFY